MDGSEARISADGQYFILADHHTDEEEEEEESTDEPKQPIRDEQAADGDAREVEGAEESEA